MIKVSVFYPYRDGCRFDFDYYCAKHLTLVRDRLGDACTGIAADKGVSGGAPGSKPPYIAIAHLFFDSIEAFQNAFNPHANEILGDIPNYTDLQPEIQISAVIVNASRSEATTLHTHLG